MYNTTSIILIIIAILLCVALIYILFNQSLHVSTYSIKHKLIPCEFHGYKILQLSDLHDKLFGTNQCKIIKLVSDIKPDLIVLTGDMIDRKSSNTEHIDALLRGISSIAPIFVVSGNHELEAPHLEQSLHNLYKQYNITYLNNESQTITKDSHSVSIYGLSYTGVPLDHLEELDPLIESRLVHAPTNSFSILLNHRSDLFDRIYSYNYSLVLSGHAHGGIIRLPIVGGILSNNHTLFPKYDNGMYTKGDSTMIVSRGLGNSNSIPRLLNRPDIVLVTLESQCSK